MRTAIRDYHRAVDAAPDNLMYDVERQRDMARACLFEVDLVLASWKAWKRAKRGP